jgi:hypothetical protein
MMLLQFSLVSQWVSEWVSEWVSKNHYLFHHTTHIFQILDVVLFGTLKKHATSLETLNEESRAAAFLLKVYRDFKQTMVEVNI